MEIVGRSQRKKPLPGVGVGGAVDFVYDVRLKNVAGGQLGDELVKMGYARVDRVVKQQQIARRIAQRAAGNCLHSAHGSFEV